MAQQKWWPGLYTCFSPNDTNGESHERIAHRASTTPPNPVHYHRIPVAYSTLGAAHLGLDNNRCIPHGPGHT